MYLLMFLSFAADAYRAAVSRSPRAVAEKGVSVGADTTMAQDELHGGLRVTIARMRCVTPTRSNTAQNCITCRRCQQSRGTLHDVELLVGEREHFFDSPSAAFAGVIVLTLSTLIRVMTSSPTGRSRKQRGHCEQANSGGCRHCGRKSVRIKRPAISR
jgi:hypothetical protein